VIQPNVRRFVHMAGARPSACPPSDVAGARPPADMAGARPPAHVAGARPPAHMAGARQVADGCAAAPAGV